MGMQGTFEKWVCEKCGTTTLLPVGYEINRWPIGRNRTWFHGANARRRIETLCPKCFLSNNIISVAK